MMSEHAEKKACSEPVKGIYSKHPLVESAYSSLLNLDEKENVAPQK